MTAGQDALAAQYNDLRKDAYGGSQLLAHQQTAPDLTLKVESGIVFVGRTKVVYAGGNSSSFTAPTTNPRIDLLTINSAGTLERTAGTEAASPSVPTYPRDKIVLAEVYNRVGQTSIKDTDDATNGYIQRDARPFLLNGKYISQDAGEIYATAGGSSNAFTLALDPAFTAYVEGMIVAFKANHEITGATTININSLGAKSIKKNGDQNLAAGDIKNGQLVLIQYDGVDFQMFSQVGALKTIDVQTFTGSGTWTKPSGFHAGSMVLIQAWGGGASGAKGDSANPTRGGGGGGGAYTEKWMPLSSLGATVTVTIGAGGAAKTTKGDGNSGGDTTFGSHLTAYGGAGGKVGSTSSDVGGGGGGSLGAGSGQTGGIPSSLYMGGTTANANSDGGGGGGATNTKGGDASNGGGAGGGGATGGVGAGTGGAGGMSFNGGGGGGGGAGATAGAGGTSVNGGAGGAGATGANNATAGSQPAGGGGGSEGGDSGAGGAGKIVVTVFA